MLQNNIHEFPITQVNSCRQFGPRDEDKEFSPAKGSEVFVARIPADFEHRELLKIFQFAGRVYDVRLMLDLNQLNKGFAFVKYRNPEEAERAIQAINGYYLGKNRGYLVAVLSTDHRTLKLSLSDCTQNVTIGHVERVFRTFCGEDLDSVTEEMPREWTSPVFYLLFRSHRSAALVIKSKYRLRIPPSWGKVAYFGWQPNYDVDERRRSSHEWRLARSTDLPPALSMASNAISAASFGVKLLRESPMLVDEASNAAAASNAGAQPILAEASNAATFNVLETNQGQQISHLLNSSTQWNSSTRESRWPLLVPKAEVDQWPQERNPREQISETSNHHSYWPLLTPKLEEAEDVKENITQQEVSERSYWPPLAPTTSEVPWPNFPPHRDQNADNNQGLRRQFSGNSSTRQESHGIPLRPATAVARLPILQQLCNPSAANPQQCENIAFNQESLSFPSEPMGAVGGYSSYQPDNIPGNSQWKFEKALNQQSSSEPMGAVGGPSRPQQRDITAVADDVFVLPPWARPIRGQGNRHRHAEGLNDPTCSKTYLRF